MSGNDESRGVRSRLRELGSYLLELSEEDTSFSAGATDGWIFSSVERKDVDDLPRLLWLALHEYEERTRRRSFLENTGNKRGHGSAGSTGLKMGQSC